MRNPSKASQDRNQQHRDPYDPNPTLVDNPTPVVAPVVAFATPEARATVIGPLRDRYDNAVAFANAEWQQAAQCQAEIDVCGQEIDDAKRIIAEAQQRIDDRERRIQSRSFDKQQHMLHGQQGCDVANPAAVFLGMAGDNVPQISAPTIEAGVVPSLVAARTDVKVHPLDVSKPLQAVQDVSQGSSMDNPPAGHCIHCGQQVWRVEPSETSPNGVTHGWGAICDPNAEAPDYADLGDGRAVAS